ncbi:hypothetical protein G7Y89_g8313 [Cudoniella acicularis]|uniref:Uncharacterized protein n=1 Tax=Cudoniella acicularis TaxID=354080 RepID=A0A8H4RHP6_9HELO|nr:hypothetical protein G7Y89_g8313 [Cudoniella acicularis]
MKFLGLIEVLFYGEKSLWKPYVLPMRTCGANAIDWQHHQRQHKNNGNNTSNNNDDDDNENDNESVAPTTDLPH